MDQGGVGRLLVASVHQGIADLLPSRVEFYESWFGPVSLREGSIGLAQMAAVLSFLRLEGAAYPLVTRRAGEYAAEWTFDSLPRLQRAALQAMPHGVRARLALRLARRLVRRTFRESHALVRLRRGVGTFEVTRSIFCSVREPAAQPLCGFYAAALGRLFSRCGINATAEHTLCRGSGHAVCSVAFVVSRVGEPVDDPAVGVSS